MSVTLADLAGASNGPTGRPTMLSVGDSLMWGQGLLPPDRFREIVRRRLGSEVVELSMARSGARVHPDEDNTASPDVSGLDQILHTSLVTPPVAAHYSPNAFARETPRAVPTTRQQLRSAAQILTEDSGGDPREISLILLDGGINDVTIEGIVLPVLAWKEGSFLSNWNAWLLKMARDVVEPQMVDTLTEALRLFPQATIVVNGYFPIFSYYSVAQSWLLKSLGVLNLPTGTPGLGFSQTLALVLNNPIGLDMLASGSAAWQAASNEHLRRAIRTARDAANRDGPNRTVLFARSGIDHENCLFGPNPWLWGYDSYPDSVPSSVGEAVQWYLGATPEDDVIPQRLGACTALSSGDAMNDALCRLASIGHPNVVGARDYARSFIEVLEDEGVIASDLHRCEQGRRRRANLCTSLGDRGGYSCLSVHAVMGETCKEWTTALGGTAGGQFVGAGNSLGSAGDAVAAIPECFDDTGAKLQACADARAADVAACNTAFVARRDGPCNVTCTRFTNCDGQFGRWNPARYVCRTARAACVASAAVAKAACIAVAAAVLAACVAVAVAKEAACKAAAVATDVACAAGKAAVAVGHVAIAAAKAIAGVAVGMVTVVVAVGCTIAGWAINRTCRLGVWVAQTACRLGSGLLVALCSLSRVFTGLGQASPRMIAERRNHGRAADR